MNTIELEEDSSEKESIKEIKHIKKNKIKNIDYLIQYFTIFLSSVGFSITLPSIWPYLQIINCDVNKSDLGLMISIFSIGQFMGGPIFGFIAQKLKSFKYPILISIFNVLFGNLIYCNLLLIKNKRLGHGLMLLARYLVGFGAGNAALTQAYITTFSEPSKKTGRIAIMSACQGLGFIFGPSIQLILSLLGYPGYLDTIFFKLNTFTGPGYFGVLTCSINIITIIIFFTDRDPNKSKGLNDTAARLFQSIRQNTSEFVLNPLSYLEKKTSVIRKSIVVNLTMFQQWDTTYESSESSKSSVETSQKWKYLKMMFISLIFFSTMVFFSALETILTPMIMDQFGFEKENATLISSICLACAGICSLIVFINIRIFNERLQDRLILAVGHVAMTVACLILIPYFGPAPPIKYNDSQSFGCPILEQKWCGTYSALSIVALIIALLFFTVGFSAISVATTVMFSECLGPGSQTIWMGLLTSVGSAARIVGPLYITAAYHSFGLVLSFGIIAALNVIIAIVIVVLYKRL